MNIDWDKVKENINGGNIMSEIGNDVMQVFSDVNEVIVQETDDYVIKKLRNGKFKKEVKYHKYMSHVPKTQEEQIELFKVLNSMGENESIIELKSMLGKTIEIHQVYTSPYQSFDEETGENTNGVSIIFKDKENWYATSSKSVYFALKGFFDTFGYLNTGKYESVTFKVVGRKRENGTQINLSLESIN